MSTRNGPIKCRNVMYVQKVDLLPNNISVEELFNIVDDKLRPKKWAGIIHDSDFKEDNTTKADEHVHIMMQFENARSLSQIAKEIGDEIQYFEKWNGNVSNGFAYLVHATKNARHKHQYSFDDVRANFDYISYMEDVMKKALKSENIISSNSVNGILDLIAIGEMTLKEAKKQLSGSMYAKNSQKLQKAHELYLERQAELLYKHMKKNGEIVCVHWFYGETETGKTFLAEKLAKIEGNYYIASATKDVFQHYQAEPIIILDELRPESIPFSELLAMFNPFSRGKTIVSSRYINKYLACKTFYITTPYDPKEFYIRYKLDGIDGGKQLYRRLASVIKFDSEYIYNMEYDSVVDCYKEVEKKENHYSKNKQNKYVINNIFDDI